MKKVIFGCLAVFMTASSFAQLYKPTCTTLGSDKGIQGVDTVKGRNLANNYSLWDNGKALNIKFIGSSSKALRDLVIKYAKEWEQYANLKFNFVPDNFNSGETVMRIKISEGFGHNSYIGLDCMYIPADEETMNLDSLGFIDVDWYIAEMKRRGISPNMEDLRKMMVKEPVKWDLKELRGTVLHEFGHALGLLHEQSYPGAISWNTDTIYKFYKKTQDWDEDQIKHNVLAVSNQFFTNGTSYDPKSIMHYSVEAWQTKNGYSLAPNYELSIGDKTIIAALYPKGKAVSDKEVPRVIVTNLTGVEVVNNKEKGGLSIYPSFDLKTNSKLGTVYVVAMLVDEDEYFIKDNNNFYNWGGYVAVYPKLTLTPNASAKYNKGQKNLELFLPYDEIPVEAGKKMKIFLRVALRDDVNDQWVYITNHLSEKSFKIQ
ncbi:MAG: hypothetical protein H0U44_00835 [Flavisolibacter sp.]|jgi:hypothetical protein|nr:hypothetical protein [Flavisolibacter sp.]